VSGLSWSWIALMVALPLPVGTLFAYPFWRKHEAIFGNIVGATVIFGIAFALILREYAELDRTITACLESGTLCWPEPSAFTRYAIYASIGLLEVFSLFIISLSVERRIRNRHYAPEWR
jgi:hypothetical protein